ncbi:MAG: hypothetical protein JWM16_4553 [Verrucomicrobiales bacterium]|nr:hypothetical protein [Verrucomicrobiales bacterium]
MQRSFLAISVIVLLMFGSGSHKAMAAGVTIITHGLDSNVDNWVISMADQMSLYYSLGGSSTCYELYFALTNNTIL